MFIGYRDKRLVLVYEAKKDLDVSKLVEVPLVKTLKQGKETVL